MLQFASGDSSAESEIAKAESMGRRNHLHDEMSWRAVGCGTTNKGIKKASRRRGSGRRRITTTEADRYVLQRARLRRTLTARQLASQLSAAAGRPTSRQTVSRRLHEGGLFARLPVICVPLSPVHVRA
ncbi:hypothetical protein AVEN_197201-1 [Araneus ventricosus]|uniref:Transposase Tc1-like domain-containing protein n=1 Tax=Araneus ventricosus TaxID=182803 RepID=A0A4Y2PHA1_ARAVE|nr:hypothetical protein AVEN_197201-1 [Araneus ventricosus]